MNEQLLEAFGKGEDCPTHHTLTVPLLAALFEHNKSLRVKALTSRDLGTLIIWVDPAWKATVRSTEADPAKAVYNRAKRQVYHLLWLPRLHFICC